ncbi:hypothetical protein AB4099_27610 [Bosea sp. 2KB_26]|uniref:hypothetical protein n=1 Tax=Bosea sp. 2KB_26 TaxID=3237475 RepID=UPI003F92A231
MTKASLPETANLLNISMDTVRRRVRSGALVGERDERGHWRVELPDEVLGNASAPTGAEQRQTVGMATPLQSSDGSPELVQALRSQIEDLRVRLDQSEAERREDKDKASAERAKLFELVERLAGGGDRK